MKPLNEEDNRNNDEIKTDVIKQLKDVKSKLKVRNTKQMRHKGLVLELQDKEDIKILNNANMESVGLKIEKPKKLIPSIIIYDVEKDAEVEDLKEDFISKNFDGFSQLEKMELKLKANFKYNFKSTEGKVNWIVQLPGKYMYKILRAEKILCNGELTE